MSTFAYIVITDSESCTVRLWTRWGDPEGVFPKLLTCVREMKLAMPEEEEEETDKAKKVGCLRDLLIGASAFAAPLTVDIGFGGPLRSYHFGSRGDAEWVYVLDTSRDALFLYKIPAAGDLAWDRCRGRIGELLRTKVVRPWRAGLKLPNMTVEDEAYALRRDQIVGALFSQLEECGWTVNPDGADLFVGAPQSSGGLAGFEFPPQRDGPFCQAFPQRGVVVPLEDFLDAVDPTGDVKYWRDRFFNEWAVAADDEVIYWGEDDNGEPTVKEKDLPWGELPADGWSWKSLGTTSPYETSAEREEDPAKMKRGVIEIFESIYAACLSDGYSTHETSAKLGRLLKRIQPFQRGRLPGIVAVRMFRAGESGNDSVSDRFCVVFDADQCFNRKLSKAGSTLTALMVREINAGCWVDWDCDDWRATQLGWNPS